MQTSIAQLRMRADGHLASAAERREHPALRLHRSMRISVVEHRASVEANAVRTSFDCQSSLPYRWTHDFRFENLADARSPAETLQSGRREQNRVVLPFIQLAQPRVDVAPHRFHN